MNIVTVTATLSVKALNLDKTWTFEYVFNLIIKIKHFEIHLIRYVYIEFSSKRNRVGRMYLSV